MTLWKVIAYCYIGFSSSNYAHWIGGLSLKNCNNPHEPDKLNEYTNLMTTTYKKKLRRENFFLKILYQYCLWDQKVYFFWIPAIQINIFNKVFWYTKILKF